MTTTQQCTSMLAQAVRQYAATSRPTIEADAIVWHGNGACVPLPGTLASLWVREDGAGRVDLDISAVPEGRLGGRTVHPVGTEQLLGEMHALVASITGAPRAD